MNRRSDRTTSWLVLAVAGAVVFAYGHFFYLPGKRRIDDLQNQLAAAETRAEGAFQLVAALGTTRLQLDQATSQVQAWQQAAPSEDEFSEVFERIHRLTRLAGTETNRFEPESPVPFETFRQVSLSIRCQGTFAELAVVLSGLENMRETLWLRDVEIQTTGQDSKLLAAEITLDVFADNLEDSDQEKLSDEPIILEEDRSGATPWAVRQQP